MYNELQSLGMDNYQVGELIPMNYQSEDTRFGFMRCGGMCAGRCGGFCAGRCGGFCAGRCGGFCAGMCGGFFI
ncbi:hypothetical protein M670_04029 [Schinkia azotoformans MEV2011]|uniref:Heterocycloanthracin/sonorensin family bacteriocin n=1 Tax=Schinkia azotoformans MEV2011 TaxID=1348973 RepID=A0A072NIQ2_SCHAZ|nr:hypothetical protein M670_04029 [Schinkia azotoformans MEV2011]